MARPSKLTPKTLSRLVEALSVGASISNACAYVGISTSLYYSWKARGQREKVRLEKGSGTEPNPDERPFLEFLDAVNRAELEAEVRALKAITRVAFGGEVKTERTVVRKPIIGKGQHLLDRDGHPLSIIIETITTVTVQPDWKAAAWLLERRWPERYGRRQATTRQPPLSPVSGHSFEEWEHGFRRRQRKQAPQANF